MARQEAGDIAGVIDTGRGYVRKPTDGRRLHKNQVSIGTRLRGGDPLPLLVREDPSPYCIVRGPNGGCLGYDEGAGAYPSACRECPVYEWVSSRPGIRDAGLGNAYRWKGPC